MAKRTNEKLNWSAVTPKADYLNRRALLGIGGVMALGAGGALLLSGSGQVSKTEDQAAVEEDVPNTLEEISTYNNFYEFGTDKADPSNKAGSLITDPWSVKIDGLVDKPGNYDLSDILGRVDLEERIYRMRCVEAWSMVIPWVGFELSTLLNSVGVQPSAKYVAFETLHRPSEMPAQKYKLLDWPYRGGLRLDEAMNPLTIMATGLYGEHLPNQNGAPIRLVVPWKYGYKSIKSVVRITLTEKQPRTTWNDIGPSEYGFYSNVNPMVSHPRWSQASERRIGEGIFAKRRTTLKFNGYEEQVASLYTGMDLSKYH